MYNQPIFTHKQIVEIVIAAVIMLTAAALLIF